MSNNLNNNNDSNLDEHKKFINTFLIKTNNRIKEPDILPDEFYLSNRAGFKNMILDEFKKYMTEKTNTDQDLDNNIFTLLTHQKFIRDYLSPKTPYRGLLLYHGLGVGKTCASIAAAELYLNKTYLLKSKKKSIDELYKNYQENDKKVVVLLPASLRANYINEIIKCGHEYYTTEQHWKHVSYDKLKKIETNILDIDDNFYKKNKGLWFSIDGKNPNFNDLDENQKEQIFNQLDFMVQKKYYIINYNGLNSNILYGKKDDKNSKKGIYDELKDDNEDYLKTYTNPNNPFNNKIVIIDEVHNFISYVLNGSKIIAPLYDMLINAEKCKILCLSGTPIINQPYEISLLLNMIKGIKYTYYLETKDDINDNKLLIINKLLEKHKYIDTFKFNIIYRRLELNILPLGFKKLKNSSKIKYSKDADKLSVVDIVNSIIDDLKEKNINFYFNKDKETKQINNNKHRYLPNNIETFKQLFVDEDDFKIKNKYLFSKRILGSVSYFEYTNSDLFPEIKTNKIIKINMSEEQLKKYIEVRKDEKRKEKKSSSNPNGDGIQVYKAFSRAICNFAFPDEINRPYPSKLKLMLKHLTNEQFDTYSSNIVNKIEKEDEKNENNIGNNKLKNIKDINTYDEILKNVLNDLDKNKIQFLNKELHLYSPKFKEILKNIKNSKGNTLVYSQFRTVEGIGILKMVLEANGFAEFKLKKVDGKFVLDIKKEDYSKPKFCEFSGDNEATPILLKIYNNNFDNLSSELKDEIYKLFSANKNIRDETTSEITVQKRKTIGNLRGELLRIMMITQSGSEGISLKNVRQINIVEPYWNKIRLDQVIGRGARTNSHIELPKKDRNLEVFTYISVFSEKHLEDDKIQRLDKGKTTDETLLEIANKKAKVNDEILDLLKSSSVDCYLHKKNHPDVTCFSYPDNYLPDRVVLKNNIIEEDEDILIYEKQEKIERKLSIVSILNTKYLILKDINNFDKESETGQLFDYDEFDQFGNYKFKGLLLKDKNENFVLRLIK
jgi:superfamily II DNA or RNA helicase